MNVKKSFNLLMVFMMLVTSLVTFQPVAAQGANKANLEKPIVADADYVAGEVVVVFANSQEKNLLGKIDQAVETATENNGEVTRLSMDGTAVIQVEGDAVAVADNLNVTARCSLCRAKLHFLHTGRTNIIGDRGLQSSILNMSFVPLLPAQPPMGKV